MNHSHTSGVRAAHDLYHTGTIRPVRTATFTRPVMDFDHEDYIDAVLAADSRLCRVVPLALAHMADELGIWRGLLGDLEGPCGMGRATVKGRLKALEDTGWVQVRRMNVGGPHAHRYIIELIEGGGR